MTRFSHSQGKACQAAGQAAATAIPWGESGYAERNQYLKRNKTDF